MNDETNTRPFASYAGPPGTESSASGEPQSIPNATAKLGGERGPFAGMPSQGYPGAPPLSAPVGVPPASDAPVPWLAGVLGLIPGVGAMYNGQFAKGLAHLAIFAVLVSLSDNVNGIFGVFVAGWVFYQAFEAFHTARARRDGLPLPNAFGLNDIGERFGFGKNWPGSGSRPTGGTPAGPAPWTAGSYPPPANNPPSSSAPDSRPYQSYPGQTPQANWAGYVPPSAFTSSAQPTAARPEIPPLPGTNPTVTGEATTSVGGSAPYTGTYSGVPLETAPGLGRFPSAALSSSPGRRFPIGAILLIALGGVFLLSNIAPAWHLNDRWLLPLLLSAGSVWVFIRRVRIASSGSLSLRPGLQRGNLICALRVPVLLMALALMFALQAAGWLTIGQTWPLLLIVLGALLLLERTLGRATTAGFGSLPANGGVQTGDLTGKGSL